MRSVSSCFVRRRLFVAVAAVGVAVVPDVSRSEPSLSQLSFDGRPAVTVAAKKRGEPKRTTRSFTARFEERMRARAARTPDATGAESRDFTASNTLELDDVLRRLAQMEAAGDRLRRKTAREDVASSAVPGDTESVAIAKEIQRQVEATVSSGGGRPASRQSARAALATVEERVDVMPPRGEHNPVTYTAVVLPTADRWIQARDQVAADHGRTSIVTSYVTWRAGDGGRDCNAVTYADQLCGKVSALEEVLYRLSGDFVFGRSLCSEVCPTGRVSALVGVATSGVSGASFEIENRAGSCHYILQKESTASWRGLEATHAYCACVPEYCVR